MALDLKLNADANVSAITVYDITGAYAVTTNEGGWGAPNPITGDATAAQVELTAPDATVPLIVTDIYPTLPNDTSAGYEINAVTDLSLEKIEDGIWTIKYVVTHPSGPFEVENKFLFTANVQCVIDKRSALINGCGTTAYDQKTFEMQVRLEAAENAACAGDYDRADSIIRALINEAECCC